MEKEKVLEIESQELFGDIAVRIKYVNIERFKKNESKKENGYTRYKDDELNFEIIKFKDAINRERYTLNLESVSVDEEYFVDITNLKISVYSKKVFEEIKKMIDLINEKYGIPKRWKPKLEESFFIVERVRTEVSFKWIVTDLVYKNDHWIDFYAINSGNCFKTYEEAEKVVLKLEELEKNFWAKIRAGEIGND